MELALLKEGPGHTKDESTRDLCFGMMANSACGAIGILFSAPLSRTVTTAAGTTEHVNWWALFWLVLFVVWFAAAAISAVLAKIRINAAQGRGSYVALMARIEGELKP